MDGQSNHDRLNCVPHKVGDVVKIINQEHVWKNEHAIVKKIKPGFSRIEIFSKLVWFPNNWLENDEPRA